LTVLRKRRNGTVPAAICGTIAIMREYKNGGLA